MTIYNPDDSVLLTVEVDDTSAAYAEVMNRDDVTLEFSLASHVEIPVGAYIIYNSRRYQLLVPAETTVVNRRDFHYVATFESDQGKFRLWRVHNLVDGRVKFTLTAKPSEHLAMLVGNLNEREGSTLWYVASGSYDSGEVTLSYNQTTIRDAMNQLADKCETEWEVYTSSNKLYISLGKVEYNATSPLALSYGEDGGFESGVKRTNSGEGLPVQVLYVQGGSKNIDPSTYFNKSYSLLLPRSYSFYFDGEKFDGETGYVSSKGVQMVTDANGYSVKIASAVRGAAEETLDLSDIYPKRVGTVSAVETEESGGDYPFYNISDSALGTGQGKLNLDYNDYWIDGEQMTVVFQTGMLTGREIGVNKDGFTLESDHGVFELCQETIDGFIMPGEGGFVPAIGDKYAVFGCALPSAYIADASTHSGAEFDMLRKAAQYLYENKDARQSFKGTLSPVYARKNWQTIGPKIVLGGYVSFSDESVQASAVSMRIMAVKTYINKPFKPEITLSNEATKGTVGGSIQHLSNNFAHTDRQLYEERGYTNRRWRDAMENIDLLQAAMLEGFSDSISPITINTMAAVVGSNNLQYEFTTSSYSTIVDRTPYFNGSGELVCYSGYIKHFSLGFDENDYVKSNRPASEYYRWTIASKTFAFTDDGPKYLYIKATKPNSPSTVGTAVYMLSSTGIPFEPQSDGDNYDTDHYYLLFGTVSSKINGSRSIATYNGFTEVTPGMIRAMKFTSTDGNQYIDFINKTFRVGDANKYFAYNLNDDGKLRLKGTIVQSPSGAEFPTPCFRGEYSSSAGYYYYGDLITYQGQSWLHIGETATAASTPPSEGATWTLYSAKGSSGAFKSTAFMRTNDDISSITPTGGTFSSPVPTSTYTESGSNPATLSWSDGIPARNGQMLWATTCTFNGDGTNSGWAHPKQMTDTDTFDVEFAKKQTNDATPATPTDANRHGGSGTQVWFDPVLDSSEDFTAMYWRAERECKNGAWGDWTIVRIKGEKGDTPYRLDLTNENASINAASDGTILTGAVRPTCEARLYFGTAAVTSGVTFTATPASGQSVAGFSYSTSNGVCTLTFNSGTASTPFSFTGTSLEITVTATVGGSVVGTAIMTVTKSMGGENAVSYWLVLDCDKVSVDPNVTPLAPSPATVSATAMYQIGENEPVSVIGSSTSLVVKYAYETETETETEATISSGIAHSVLLSNATSGDKYIALHFYLYSVSDNTPKLVDQETVPILYQGKDGTNGTSGTNGKVMRGRSAWSSKGFDGSGAYQGRDDSPSEYPDNQYIDIVLYRASDTDDGTTYLCTHAHDPSLYDPSSSSYWSNYWEEMNNFSLIATDAIYAKQLAAESAVVDKLQTNLSSARTDYVIIQDNTMNVMDTSGKPVVQVSSASTMSQSDATVQGFTRSGSLRDGVGTASSTSYEGEAFNGLEVNSDNNMASLTAFNVTLELYDGNDQVELDRVARIRPFLINTNNNERTYLPQEFYGPAHNFASLEVPAQKVIVPAGHWALRVRFEVQTIESGYKIHGSISSVTLSGTYFSTANMTKIVGDGFLTQWGSYGFKATSGGAKVIQGGTVLEAVGGGALNGLTAPKKIYVCTSSPGNNAEDGAFYFIVAASS